MVELRTHPQPKGRDWTSLHLRMRAPVPYPTDDELLLGIGTLRGVAGTTEQLEVIEMMASALSLRDDMVDGEIAERKQHAATVAHQFTHLRC